MKKYLTIALAAMALSVASCKKDAPAASTNDTDSTKKENVEKDSKKPSDVEAQYARFLSEMRKAIDEGDLEKAQSIQKDGDEWWESLTGDEKEEAKAYKKAHEKEICAINDDFHELKEATEAPIEEEEYDATQEFDEGYDF